MRPGTGLTVAGLFAGIGGIELGLHRAGHRCEWLCEIDPAAQRVLRARFPGCHIEADIGQLKEIPDADLVTAGFPCQDLSQAGRTDGIEGKRSGLVAKVFPLIPPCPRGPRWLLFENVPFMLQLHRGKAMRYLIDELEKLGYAWAYRVVNAQAFGRPQRRNRVFLLASRSDDPRAVLLVDDAGRPKQHSGKNRPCGFYWTEGNGGVGWAFDGIPPLKGASHLCIPSPPAIWLPDTGDIVTPDIRDAERLQGFPKYWTLPSILDDKTGRDPRWRLVGNAVCVPVAKWLGERLRHPGVFDVRDDEILDPGSPLPMAAWGRNGEIHKVRVSEWPVRAPYRHLADFLKFPMVPLSARAADGFLRRAKVSGVGVPAEFLKDLERHVERRRQLPTSRKAGNGKAETIGSKLVRADLESAVVREPTNGSLNGHVLPMEAIVLGG